MDSRQRFIVILTALSEWKNVKLPVPVIEIYDGFAKQVGYDKATAALQQFMAEGKMPSPDELKRRASSDTSATDGEYVAGRILWAADKIGRYDIDGVKAHVGDIGMEAITLFGGLSAVCDLNKKELGTARAQLRDYVNTVISRAKAGTLGNVPQLPISNNLAIQRETSRHKEIEGKNVAGYRQEGDR